MPIHLYVEHLLNIRALSIQASLSTQSNRETKATLSADGRTLSVSHEGETASVRLPVQVAGSGDATLALPTASTQDLSFRVQLEEKPGVNGLLSNGHSDGNAVPWTANSLSAETEVRCRICRCVLIERGKILTWKDLPSEGWAEMMEFWHCHKPDEPHMHDHESTDKGYAANGQLALEPGVGLVGTMDFLITTEDCQNVTYCTEHPQTDQLVCTNCGSLVGGLGPASQGYRLRKPYLSVSTSPDTAAVSYQLEPWLACNLLSACEDHGAQKFLVYSTLQKDKALEIWILTPDMTVSASNSASIEPLRVAKILWRTYDERPEVGRLSAQNLGKGELELPSSEICEMCIYLKRSSRVLPESARKFQQWDVGLLKRFKDNELHK